VTGQLFFGDNLEVMREKVPAHSADLVYLDPPFNSDARYNVFFQSPADMAASAQAEAFRDTWRWDHEAEAAYHECIRLGGPLASMVNALFGALGSSDMMAYLVMMAIRLHELRRILKPTGSVFLHCDPTASHYLKIIMDSVFGPGLFRNEIVWRRNPAKGLATRRLPSNHDVVLVYAGSDASYWNAQEAFVPYDASNLPEKTLRQYAKMDNHGRRYQLTSLLNPNNDRPNLRYEFLGVIRTWRWTKERMMAAFDEGLIEQSGQGMVPRYRRYLDEQRGIPLDDIWTDIDRLHPTDAERLGYPTQKPLALLNRIIGLASPPDATIFDPFCGCGTSVHSAQSLGRNWIGIDIAFHAIQVISARLEREAGIKPGVDFALQGIPRDYLSALELARSDKFQFQWWANHLVGVQQMREVKRGPDRGIDGEMFFPAGPGRGRGGYGRILTSVKGGKSVGVSDVRDFLGTLGREKAEGGLFICLRPPTRDMIANAASAGFFEHAGRRYPRMQIISIEEWFGRSVRPDIPALAHLPQPNEARLSQQKREKSGDQAEMLFSFPSDMADPAGKPHLNPLTAFQPSRRAV